MNCDRKRYYPAFGPCSPDTVEPYVYRWDHDGTVETPAIPLCGRHAESAKRSVFRGQQLVAQSSLEVIEHD